MKKLFSEIPYIKTERLVLRKIEETDAEGLSELTHSPDVYRYLPTFLVAGIEIITASTMVENKSITRVVEKNGFLLAVSGVDEDWGYPQPTPANKWVWLL